VDLLIQKGAAINAKDKAGDTPLHISIVEGNNNVALRLVQEGADVELENGEEKNAMELAQGEFRSTLINVAKSVSLEKKK